METPHKEFMKIFVLDKHHTPLAPCSPRRAKELLKSGRAVVHKRYPFTIRVKDCLASDCTVQPLTLKIDPGSKTTGIAITSSQEKSDGIKENSVFLCELEHHSVKITNDMSSRASMRRGRRTRNLRYRQPRFLNRTKENGWLAPSVRARVEGVEILCNKFKSLCNVDKIDIEYAIFDTQKMINSDIAGVEYQQGTLFGYEVREYILQRDNRQCAYCDATNVPLNIDHWIPRNPKNGQEKGTDRVGNLVLACIPCNQRKGNTAGPEFVKDAKRLATIQSKMSKNLSNATQTNILRKFIYQRLCGTYGENNVRGWNSSRTKFNRHKFGIKKTHSLDALCVGDMNEVKVAKISPVLHIKSMGRGNRQMCQTDKFGFPKCIRSRQRKANGYQTGDIIEVNISKEGRIVPCGRYTTRITKTGGGFRGVVLDKTVKLSFKDMGVILHRADGYNYRFSNVTTNKL